MKCQNITKKINTSNGEEEVTYSKQYTVKIDSDKFYMVFIESIARLFQVKSATDRAILDYMMTVSDFNTNKVRLVADDRKLLADSLGISLQAVSNSISNLRKLKVISGEKGLYFVNPDLMWKGSSEARNQLLRDKGLELKILFQLED